MKGTELLRPQACPLGFWLSNWLPAKEVEVPDPDEPIATNEEEFGPPWEKRIGTLERQLTKAFERIRELKAELVATKRELATLRASYDGMREVNHLWDGS